MAKETKSSDQKKVEAAAKKVANFKRLANVRVNKAIKAIDIVGALAAPASYTWDTSQANRIKMALEQAVAKVSKALDNPKEAKATGSFELT